MVYNSANDYAMLHRFTTGTLFATHRVIMTTTTTIAEFSEFLGPYGVVETDPGCGEPVSWGHPIIKHLGPLWDKLKQCHKVYYDNSNYPRTGQYYVITKTLSRSEAIEKYGAVTDEMYGPMGGFKWVELNGKRFYAKSLGCPIAAREFKARRKK